VADRFDFQSSTLAFIDGPYQSDEVRYDFRFENFYTENYYQTFDFQALASSAGLSGSARDLAGLVSQALDMEPLTILDGDMNSDCNAAETQACYGYGVYRYQPDEEAMPLYIHGGKLPGSPSAIVIDPKGVFWSGSVPAAPGPEATPPRRFMATFVRRLPAITERCP